MQYQQAQSMSPVIGLGEEARVTFLVKVYQHLALAVGAFVLFEYILFQLGVPEMMFDLLDRTGGIGWLAILGGVGIVNMLASRSLYKVDKPGMQYMALFVSALMQAVIFAPILFRAFNEPGQEGTVTQAAAVTLVGFFALSIVAYTTRRDLSFLKPIIMWVGILALVAIVASVLFGLNLGLWFSLAMVGLSGASILYNTQKIYKQYPESAYVGAAVSLFSSLMLMFYYMIRIFMDR